MSKERGGSGKASDIRVFAARCVFGATMAGFWVASLFLPVAYFVDDPEPIPGFALLAMGWMGILVLQPAWFANLALLVVLPTAVLVRDPGPRLLRYGAFVLIGCGFASLLWGEWPRRIDTDPIRFGIGYFLWLASMVCTGFMALYRSDARLVSGE